MSLLSLRDAIRDSLASEVKGFAECYTHGGRFDLEEVMRWAVRAPCAMVGAIGVPAVEYEGGQVVVNCEWAAFIVTKDTPEMKRDSSALVLLEAMLGVITPIQRWGDDAAHAPDSIKGSNLYGGKLDKTGIALWAVTWTQGYDINRFDPDTLADFLRYRATVSISDDADVPAVSVAVDLPSTGS